MLFEWYCNSPGEVFSVYLAIVDSSGITIELVENSKSVFDELDGYL